jgi:hypothetical protein
MHHILTIYLGLSLLEFDLVCSPTTQKNPCRQLSDLHKKSTNEVVMWAPCPYVFPLSQHPCIHLEAFKIPFSHSSHPWDPDSRTFTMILSDSPFNLEPQEPILATLGICTPTYPHFIIMQLLYTCLIFKRYVSRRVFGLNMKDFTYNPSHTVIHGISWILQVYISKWNIIQPSTLSFI